VYCEQFVGEAKNMLYRLKNRMNIAVPKLKSLQDIHLYDDGTTITVRSVFGQDFIEINAGRGFPSCLIKLLDLPEAIPPMKWYAPGQETFTKGEGGWVITGPDGKTEVEGVDYIKTYFSWVTRDCPSCSPLEFTVAKGDDANILTGSSPNRPFWYKSENDDGSLIYNYEGAMVPHYMGYTTGLGIVIPDNPLNHTIYSLSGCQAQILKNGSKWSFSDAGGSYFLWKAYTEWSNVGPHVVDFSRAGLGYMLMQGFIKNEGKNLCESKPIIIKVDCCLKDIEHRSVEIWWEDFGTCQPFMNYGGVTICKMPTEVPMGGTAGLAWYGCTHPQQPLYAIPEIKGSCLPIEWTLSGPIALWNSKKNDNIIYFKCLEAGCNDPATITLRDRCGTEYIVRGSPCCQDAKEPSILYTSLLMSCGQYQTLNAFGGCGPYSWSISGGGGTLNTNTGSEVIYHAPATNANCTDNPTITVTDCCGGSANLQLAINCYSASGTALGYTSLEVCECRHYTNCNICGFCYYGSGNWHTRKWDCSGTLTYDCETNPGCSVGSWPSCGSYTGDQGCFSETNCWTNQCGCGCGPSCPCNAIKDCRTQAQKDAGCCPINPLTGLPY